MAIKISHSWFHVAVLRLRILALCWFEPRTHPVHQPKYDWYQAGGLLRPVQWLDSKPVAPVCPCWSYLIDSYINTLRLFSVSGFSGNNQSKSELSALPLKERERERERAGQIWIWWSCSRFLCICFLVKKVVPPSLGPRSVCNLSREMRLKVSRVSFKHSAVSHFRASHLQFIQKWFASFLFVCIWGRKLLWDIVASSAPWFIQCVSSAQWWHLGVWVRRG